MNDPTEWLEDLEGHTIGPYTVVSKLHEDEFSLLYVAEQIERFRRRVALKTLKRAVGAENAIDWHETELRAYAQVNHPGVPALLRSGRAKSGRPYFALQPVEGVGIADSFSSRFT